MYGIRFVCNLTGIDLQRMEGKDYSAAFGGNNFEGTRELLREEKILCQIKT